jgi:hypothetical protein
MKYFNCPMSSSFIFSSFERKYKMWIKFFRIYMYASRSYFFTSCSNCIAAMKLPFYENHTKFIPSNVYRTLWCVAIQPENRKTYSIITCWQNSQQTCSIHSNFFAWLVNSRCTAYSLFWHKWRGTDRCVNIQWYNLNIHVYNLYIYTCKYHEC